MEIIERNNVRFLAEPALWQRGVKHGFTLRYGGVSSGEYASLNVGLNRGDDRKNAVTNIYIAARALELNEKNLTLTYQTHTANVHFLTENEVGLGIETKWDSDGIDGIVTDMEKVPLMCYSADCVPTLFYDGVRRMAGAVHGGWRGTAQQIVKNAVHVMQEHGCRAENIEVLIGPAIGMCCYEVSEDVGVIFKDEFPECVTDKGNGKYMIDLKEITRLQLLHAGLLEKNIINSGICTSCSNDMFFSHRAQKGRSGLLGGFIQLS